MILPRRKWVNTYNSGDTWAKYGWEALSQNTKLRKIKQNFGETKLEIIFKNNSVS
jgi:hypothetical protein